MKKEQMQQTSGQNDRPISEQPLGYIIAIIGGTLGAPLGWISSPLVLLALNKFVTKKPGSKNPNRFLYWALVGVVGAPASLAPTILWSNSYTEQEIRDCNLGNLEKCRSVPKSRHNQLTNKEFLAEYAENQWLIQDREEVAREERKQAGQRIRDELASKEQQPKRESGQVVQEVKDEQVSIEELERQDQEAQRELEETERFVEEQAKGNDTRMKAVTLAACKSAARERLKAPSTAKFPGIFSADYSDSARRLEGNVYRMDSYVDSQNSYGAMMRSRFVCDVEIVPALDYKYRLVSFNFYD